MFVYLLYKNNQHAFEAAENAPVGLVISEVRHHFKVDIPGDKFQVFHDVPLKPITPIPPTSGAAPLFVETLAMLHFVTNRFCSPGQC